MKQAIKKAIGILLVVLILLQVNIVLAVSEQDLIKEQDKINDKINEAHDNIEDIQKEKSATMKEVQKLINEISEYEAEIDNLEGQISSLQIKIDETQKNLNVKEQEYNKQKQQSEDILVTMYEQGETTYLDVLLSSTSIVEFISNYYLVSELASYNVELLENIEKQRIEIENEKTELENNKKQLDEAKKSKESKYNELKKSKAQKDQYAKKLTEDEKREQKELEEFEADKREILNELKRLQEESKVNSGESIVGTPSKSGYIFPVAGLGKGNINNKNYPSYPGHTGTDVNINVRGKKVVAVKAGTVVTSTALKGSIPNYGTNGKYVGSYRSYGEYVVINHHDGTMTLYGHMLAGSRKVSVGQKVSQGQVLGTVGNTGNCSPRPTASNPLKGTHLHFEVIINGKRVNPLPYLP